MKSLAKEIYNSYYTKFNNVRNKFVKLPYNKKHIFENGESISYGDIYTINFIIKHGFSVLEKFSESARPSDDVYYDYGENGQMIKHVLENDAPAILWGESLSTIPALIAFMQKYLPMMINAMQGEVKNKPNKLKGVRTNVRVNFRKML